jgi:hypothetical protein
MVVVPLSNYANESEPAPRAVEAETMNWVELAAAGTLIAGGLLLLAGHRRSGTVAAASGAALALLDQQETLRSWWHTLPSYIDDVQRLLGQVQGTVDDIAAQRQKLRRILAK